MADKVQGTETRHSLTSQIISKLKDSRFWVIAGPALVLSGIALTFLDTRIAGIVTLAINLIASYLIRLIDQFAQPESTFAASAFYQNTLAPCLVGIAFVAGSDIFVRLCLIPWHLFHTKGAIPSCTTLISFSVIDWLGLVISCLVVASLMGKRTNFAIMFGLAFYIPLNIADVLTGDSATKTVQLLATSCKWDLGDPADLDVSALSFGMAAGVISRALFGIIVAKLILAWRSRRGNSSSGLHIEQ